MAGVNGGKIVARVEITLDAAGQLLVNGPIQDKILCYGMLERARDVIQAYDPAAQKPGLEIPSGPVPPEIIRRMRGE